MTERLTDIDRRDLALHVQEARQRWRRLRRKLAGLPVAPDRRPRKERTNIFERQEVPC